MFLPLLNPIINIAVKKLLDVYVSYWRAISIRAIMNVGVGSKLVSAGLGVSLSWWQSAENSFGRDL